MSNNPLTDPTSLIAYRLANAASSPRTKRPTRDVPGKKPLVATGIIGLALLIAVIVALASI